LRRNCLLKHIKEGKIEGRIELTERRGRIRKHLLDDLKGEKRILEIASGSNKEHSVENSFWKILGVCS
jgi:hypothetical protein